MSLFPFPIRTKNPSRSCAPPQPPNSPTPRSAFKAERYEQLANERAENIAFDEVFDCGLRTASADELEQYAAPNSYAIALAKLKEQNR